MWLKIQGTKQNLTFAVIITKSKAVIVLRSRRGVGMKATEQTPFTLVLSDL